MKVTPSIQVFDWVAKQSRAGLFTTTVTMAEVFNGVESLPKGRRRAESGCGRHGSV